ncbi:hotdog fold domain-containing protein [Streptomyces sp. AC495_CC817]|uniref:hotdog fold domain-containing protein n=1 Tax=Streptomyces sp. AC495_CC817 TaxID=2823900 RepID=UPI001C28081E|nr:hotdog fold domain-containing protein [Streptomyces sp. AC495_CC817]
MSDSETITVPDLLRGYPGVAFGGYVAGMLARCAEAGSVRVDFRRPTPVEVPVGLARTADGGAVLTGADGDLAVAVPDDEDLAALGVPAPPSWAEATAAAEAYRAAPPTGSVDCFGCGLDRTPDTGLRLHCGGVPGREVVATAWTPGAALADADGILPAELVWGALDCPGNAAGRLLGTMREGAVTASLAARLLRPVPIASRLVSYAWVVAEEGRKHRVGAALATAEGDLCGLSSALWVAPRQG